MGDGTQCENTKFTVTTTSDIAVGTEFDFYMSALGTFYVDCGDGGVLSGTGVSGKTITRSNGNEEKYTCTYSTAGAKTIRFGGLATGYSSSDNNPAIRIFSGTIDRTANSMTSAGTETYVAAISGSLGAIFPSLANSQPSFYMALRHMVNIDCEIPANLFSGVSGATRPMMFYSAFLSSSFIGAIPSGLFSGITGAGSWAFGYAFNGCNRLTSIPSNLFQNITTVSNYAFYGTFQYCTGITVIPDGLFSGITNAETWAFSLLFRGCSNLSGYIPPSTFGGLIANNHPTATGMWAGAFDGTQIATSCPSGTTQYVTGYEGTGNNIDWNGKVSCQCAAGYYSANGETNCTACTTDPTTGRPTYSTTAGATSCTVCPAATAYADRVTGYGYWSNDGVHNVAWGCRANITEQDPTGNYTLSCSCASGDYGVASCSSGDCCMASQVTSCAAGYYAPYDNPGKLGGSKWAPTVAAMEGAVCVPVGTGYYSAAGDLTRTPNTITIEWDGANGTYQTGSCTYDGAITTPTVAPTRRGYRFDGWTFVTE